MSKNDWNVLRVRPTPVNEDDDGPYPNENEPSDHLMISADLQLLR